MFIFTNWGIFFTNLFIVSCPRRPSIL